MTATLAINNPGVFTDEVYTSTDLSRRASEVLNRARMCPVTISRNGEQFALLRREQAAELFSALAIMKSVVIFLSELRAELAGNPVSEPFAWLNAFEKDDLEKLSLEVSTAMQRAACGQAAWMTFFMIVSIISQRLTPPFCPV